MRSRNTYIRAPRFFTSEENLFIIYKPSEDPKSLAIFNLLKASDKFRSIRSMPIPAETDLENRQVNGLLPLNIFF
jgi:hypothetical protein